MYVQSVTVYQSCCKEVMNQQVCKVILREYLPHPVVHAYTVLHT